MASSHCRWGGGGGGGTGGVTCWLLLAVSMCLLCTQACTAVRVPAVVNRSGRLQTAQPPDAPPYSRPMLSCCTEVLLAALPTVPCGVLRTVLLTVLLVAMHMVLLPVLSTVLLTVLPPILYCRTRTATGHDHRALPEAAGAAARHPAPG